jgi:hypothetical protein
MIYMEIAIAWQVTFLSIKEVVAERDSATPKIRKQMCQTFDNIMDAGFLQTYLFYTWLGLIPPPNSFKLLLNNIFINQSNILCLIILPMDNTFNKAEFIRKAAETYKIDSILGMRGAATIYECSHQSIHNRLTKKNQPAPNIFIFQQKIWPVEESVLVEYYIRNFKAGFLIIIQYSTLASTNYWKHEILMKLLVIIDITAFQASSSN